MSVFTDAEAKLVELKNRVEGDLHDLAVKLESVLQHVHQAPVEDVVKTAVASDIHTAAIKIAAVADTMRSDVDVVDKVVDTADVVVDKTAAK